MNYDAELEKVMTEIMAESEKMFKDAIEYKRLVLTGELKDNFERFVVKKASGIAGEIVYNGYGRYKDMKVLRYSNHMPPVDAMEFFIEKTGTSKFPFTPGYKNKRVVTISDVNRLAWAFSRSKRIAVNQNRGYRGTWYNENKMKMVNVAKKRLRWLTSEFSSWQVAQQLAGNP
ncbi:hypothetical protein [Flectobacillus major]|uniref:hypothetical protein n=1 Tax=Flectobacillus major TaxID=103 RepID=UPI00047C2295|nr:hypothetical protein [Flectobacillus major]